jgi:thiopeptide-type bacteriocin biosynthesis protein
MPLIGELSEGLLDRRLIARATLDTYERELERYGGAAAIAHCEDWFHADSEAALGALQAGHRARGAADWRWRVALLATDAALAAFGLGTDAKRDAMRCARRHRMHNLAAQTAGDVPERTFAERYAKRHRAERAELQHALAQARDGVAGGPYRAYAERAARFEEVARALLAAHRDGALSRSPGAVCLSLVHMRVNRLLAVGSIEAEVRLYDALERLYASELARTGVGGARF